MDLVGHAMVAFRKPVGYFDGVEAAVVAMNQRGASLEADPKSNMITASHQASRSEPTYSYVLTQVDDRCTNPEIIGKWYWLEQDPVMPDPDPVDHVMYVFRTLSESNKLRFLSRAATDNW